MHVSSAYFEDDFLDKSVRRYSSPDIFFFFFKKNCAIFFKNNINVCIYFFNFAYLIVIEGDWVGRGKEEDKKKRVLNI